jgi:hypothetical protein
MGLTYSLVVTAPEFVAGGLFLMAAGSGLTLWVLRDLVWPRPRAIAVADLRQTLRVEDDVTVNVDVAALVAECRESGEGES